MTGGELAVACLLDAAVGDPRWFPHPVRWMGSIVNWYDRRVHQLLLSPAKQRMAGVLLAVALPAGVYGVGALLIWFGNSIDPLWGSAATGAAGVDYARGSRSYRPCRIRTTGSPIRLIDGSSISGRQDCRTRYGGDG